MDRRAILDYLQFKKTVHTELAVNTYNDLRDFLKEQGGLSLNQVFAEFAERVLMGDPYTTRLIEELRSRNQHRAVRMKNSDIEDLFSILERESPLNAHREDER